MLSNKQHKMSFIPGSDADSDDIFKYPFTIEDNTIEYLQNHGRIMFIIRGPAGTGKDSLAAMLSSKERYPGAVICCADHYFQQTFASGKRDSKSLKVSHDYCRKKVETSCQKGCHPIIVKNTHVRKSEMQNYLNLAAEHNYTIIIASTLHKFTISPEILAKSNTKGLSVEYFTARLRQWQEILPILVGWFLSPGDSSHLLNALKISLEYILGDGKFCRVLNIFDNEKLFEHYKVQRLLYCIAACSEKNYFPDLRFYYNSDEVKDHYGECFNLIIQGFLITPHAILAIVHLDKTMRELHQSETFINSTSKSDCKNLDMQSLYISPTFHQDNFAYLSKLCSFKERYDKSASNTVSFLEWEQEDVIDIKSCSCILLAQKGTEMNALPWHFKMNFHKMLAEVANTEGFITSDQFGELEDSYRYCRLPRNAWILKHPNKISLKSVFTGMYV